jgi:hypothetical protein
MSTETMPLNANANVTTVRLTDAELAMVLANRNQTTAEVEEPKAAATGFMARMQALVGTNLQRYLSPRPAATIMTQKGPRGVFWVGMKLGVLRIGTCKVTQAGRCYKPGQYDGAFFQDAEHLVALNPE